MEYGRDTIVVDLSTPPTPDLTRQIGPRVARFLQPKWETDLEHTLAPLVDQYADLILLCPPPPSLTNPRSAVAAIKRVLRSGGRVWMEFPVASQPPKWDWRAALESECLWVDVDEQFTPIAMAAEYTRRGPDTPSGPREEKDANCVQPCYRRVSGIK